MTHAHLRFARTGSRCGERKVAKGVARPRASRSLKGVVRTGGPGAHIRAGADGGTDSSGRLLSVDGKRPAEWEPGVDPTKEAVGVLTAAA
jgi:hypothetical protein